MRKRLLATLVLICLGVTAYAAVGTIDIPLTGQRRITGQYPTYSDTTLIVGKYGTAADSPNRSLIQFDALNQFTSITSATVRLYRSQGWSAAGLNMDCYRITSAWGTGTCWNNQPGYSATPVAGAFWSWGGGEGNVFSMDVTSTVQGWFANPSTNYGLMFKQQNENIDQDIWWFNGTYSVLRVTGELDSAVTPEQFGAVGDGVTNDTTAFQLAAQAIQNAGGGTLRLAPGKTYRVGRQYHVAGQYPYWKHESVFYVHDLANPLIIEGNNSLVKTADGLRYGSFDKNTGQPINPAMPCYDFDLVAAIGNLFQINGCADVEIRNLRIDGNINGHILGGLWGDTGRQIQATGICMYGNDDVTILDTESSYNACDGLIIGYDGLNSGSPATPHYLENVNCYYNARQGLSWVGGIGLTGINCKFNHTGKMRFSSAPSAGLDLEAEGSVVRDGYFYNCEFINNTGAGMVADSGDVANAQFVLCTFWGTTNFSVWPRKPGIVFNTCTFRGTVVNVYGSSDANQATKFISGWFDDNPDLGYPVYRSAALVEVHGQNVLFDGCYFHCYQNRSMYIDDPPTSNREIIQNCSIYHYWNGLGAGGFQALILGAYITNTHFYEWGLSNPYYIAVNNVKVGPSVYVDGPRVKWGSTNGLTGLIPQN
ncbi:MAG: DNRLRE domain-containing protein [Armatimonadota bacterium]